jgi:putative FmdB family regulatory protein
MPTYEYVCETCSHLFEQFQSMTDDPIKKCPKCGADVRRLISSGAGVIFKGNGFYQTDYKNSTHKASGEDSSTKKGPAPCGKSGTCSSCEVND